MIRHLIAPLMLPALFVGLIVLTLPLGSAAQAEEVSIAGCIQAGQNEGQFVLAADDKQTYQIHAAEELEVASHLNHRVELTGVVDKGETVLMLKVSALKMVANLCDP